METNTGAFAQRELSVLEKVNPHSKLVELKSQIIDLAEAFGKSGQSGGSAPCEANNYTLAFIGNHKSIENESDIGKAIRDLLLQRPICDITGLDEEWVDMSEYNGGKMLFQNIRCSALFKDETGVYYLDAIVFKDQEGTTFTSNSVMLGDEKISSSQYVQSFPFSPKTFYIDVISTEWADAEETVEKKGGGWWTSKIKDDGQLERVFKYYRR